MKLLYILPSKSRPQNFFRAVDNITSLAKHPNYQIIASLDVDDPLMFNQDVYEKMIPYSHLKPYYGTSKNKIDAINRDVALAEPWDILINMSDDMLFIQEGFDLQFIKDFEREGLDVLMHYPDNKAKWALITMAIMGREYYQRFGYIYNPIYKSLYCDNEQMLVAKKLGRHRFINKRLFDHLHPAWGLAEKDALYLHTLSFNAEDKATFEKRKEINFGLSW